MKPCNCKGKEKIYKSLKYSEERDDDKKTRFTVKMFIFFEIVFLWILMFILIIIVTPFMFLISIIKNIFGKKTNIKLNKLMKIFRYNG